MNTSSYHTTLTIRPGHGQTYTDTHIYCGYVPYKVYVT